MRCAYRASGTATTMAIEATSRLQRLRTAEEIGNWLGKSRAAVYEDNRRGAFPPAAIVRLGRRLYFDEDVLRKWIEANRGGGDEQRAVRAGRDR